MASKRDTTVPQDSVYCLFGILDVYMNVIPAEPQYHAVGRLLQKVITCSESKDVSCLAWVGKPSQLSSWLPTQIKMYYGRCHTPSSIGEEEIQRSVSELESSLTREYEEQALAFCDKLEHLRRAEFNGWHLRLPCIAFPVIAFEPDRISKSNAKVYIARATALEETRARHMDTNNMARQITIVVDQIISMSTTITLGCQHPPVSFPHL
ncbi:hypothetical protein JVT61DRAFT_3553 [Boletus reticuloceps]|uniref:Uncharacterized protein n=1 Tax=Boletus reticuloceps TaxID=495285 RepID=A0A8I2YNH5_9AGAM|nr:hypothetical protein JVT61DRAFT_3553 [Boletus reticuloceps]